MSAEGSATALEASAGADNPAFEPDEHSAAANGKPRDAAAAAAAAAADAAQGAGVEAAEGEERAQWGSPMEFLMSCIAMSVGLGNIWRFPYTAYDNGGGAFLIPYIIVLIVIGRPLYYLEMGLGQFASRGCVKIWQLAPALRGVGYGQITATACVLSYYSSLMALTFFYLIMSFQAQLPWAECRPEWGPCVAASGKSSVASAGNASLADPAPPKARSSAELYFILDVLREKDDLSEGMGAPDWRLTLCLLGSWLLILGVQARGVRSSGKAAYFLALFPYVVLFILLVRGCTLPGATKGMLYFVLPQWEKLLDPAVWYAAVSQAFFSLSVCFGTLIVYSSYNDFNHNVHRDAIIVTTLDTFTSLLAGCTIFAILGNLAHELGKDVTEVVNGGAGLAFVSYPDAIAKFDWVPQVFSVLFFLMLFTLGVGSAVALAGAVITIVCDQFPTLRYGYVSAAVCAIGFLVGLVYVTPGGQFVLTVVDYYSVTFIVFIMACIEMMAVSWIYGVDNLCEDMEFMLGFRVGAYWRLCWGLLTPLLLAGILLYSLVRLEPQMYQGVAFPPSAYSAAGVLLVVGVLAVPAGLFLQVGREARALRDASGGPLPLLPWRAAFWSFWASATAAAFRPNALWRPKAHKHFKEWQDFKAARARAAARSREPRWCRLLRRFTGLPIPAS